MSRSTGPDAVFQALSDPTRREVMRRLSEDGPTTLGELASGLPVTRQAVSKHLIGARGRGLGARVGRHPPAGRTASRRARSPTRWAGWSTSVPNGTTGSIRSVGTWSGAGSTDRSGNGGRREPVDGVRRTRTRVPRRVVMTVTPPSPIARQDPSDHTAAARSSMPRRITSSDGRPSSADVTHSRPNVAKCGSTATFGTSPSASRYRRSRSPGTRPRISVHRPMRHGAGRRSRQRRAAIATPRRSPARPANRPTRRERCPGRRPPDRRTGPSFASAAVSARTRLRLRFRTGSSTTSRPNRANHSCACATASSGRCRAAAVATTYAGPSPAAAASSASCGSLPGCSSSPPTSARGPAMRRSLRRAASGRPTYAWSMPSLYEMAADIPFVAPVMVGAFDGWIDASGAATSAAATARRERRGRREVRRATRCTTTAPGGPCSTWSTARSRGWSGRS